MKETYQKKMAEDRKERDFWKAGIENSHIGTKKPGNVPSVPRVSRFPEVLGTS
jgi:hypothetical protein